MEVNMEPEYLNQIQASIQDLKERVESLRGYL